MSTRLVQIPTYGNTALTPAPKKYTYSSGTGNKIKPKETMANFAKKEGVNCWEQNSKYRR